MKSSAIFTAAMAVLAIGLIPGCAAPRADHVEYALPSCESGTDQPCLVQFIPSEEDMESRETRRFPRRYLELSSEDVRVEECRRLVAAGADESQEKCMARLNLLVKHFTPAKMDKDIGVALEGGGSKAGSFALGALAGLQTAGILESRVGAIASVSGGSYAASFLYHRYFDRYSTRRISFDAGTADDWFRSCVPDEFMFNAVKMDGLKWDTKNLYPCGESKREPGLYLTGLKYRGEFLPPFAFQGHVWSHQDLLRVVDDSDLRLSGKPAAVLEPTANFVILLGGTIASMPFQALSRTVFHWPLNSSPTKVAYGHGVERQYSYAPHEWWRATGARSEIDPAFTREGDERTMANLKDMIEKHGLPQWILGSASPMVSGASWLKTPSRDPVRHQFEITPHGFGSGVFGYARIPPQAGFETIKGHVAHMSITDAVVTSAAFFDDNQSLVSGQPARLLAAAGQHFTNLTWFTEIRNYNVPGQWRFAQWLLPWPLYSPMISQGRKNPYIHLNDGGNTDNTAILPLLRRGYKKIVYVHGTQDTEAKMAALCHLKNQLELDGQYYVDSRDLDRIVESAHRVAGNSAAPKSSAATSGARQGIAAIAYLDQLCEEEFDVSDLVTFDFNLSRDEGERIPAVAKLFCQRLGYGFSVPIDQPDPGYVPCAEFVDRFAPKLGWAFQKIKEPAPAKEMDLTPVRLMTNLFYFWPDSPFLLHVCRVDPAHKVASGSRARVRDDAECVEESKNRIATISAVIPAVSARAASSQLVRKDSTQPAWQGENWGEFCEPDRDERPAQFDVAMCVGPDLNPYTKNGVTREAAMDHGQPIPCTSLAYLLTHTCQASQAGASRLPAFPQNNFVIQTLNSTYTQYGAYYELGRAQANRALKALEAKNAPTASSR